MTDDRGAPISYLVLAEGTAVQSSDGRRLGTVKRVLADTEADIFDGLIVETGDGDRFVDAPNVAALHERAVVLALSAEDAQHMPEPMANPATMEPTPDDIAGETPGDSVRQRLQQAWDRVSGNY